MTRAEVVDRIDAWADLLAELDGLEVRTATAARRLAADDTDIAALRHDIAAQRAHAVDTLACLHQMAAMLEPGTLH